LQQSYLQELEKETSWTHAILTVPQESAAALKQTLCHKAIQGKFLQVSDITPESMQNSGLPPPPPPRESAGWRNPAKTDLADEQVNSVHHNDAEQDNAAGPGATPGQCTTPSEDLPEPIEALQCKAIGGASNTPEASAQGLADGKPVDMASVVDVDAEAEPATITPQVQNTLTNRALNAFLCANC
jgi:hypothetical protein